MGVPLSEAQWSLASLPIRHGGLGAIDPVFIYPQAAVASFISSASGSTGIELSTLPPDLLEPILALRAIVLGMAETLSSLWSSSSFEGLLADRGIEAWGNQKVWSFAMDQVAAARFDAEACSRMMRLRRLHAGAHADAWVASLLLEKDGCASFSSAEWQALLRLRCGVLFQGDSKCGGCSSTSDRFGDHALSCSACGLYARHNRLRDALAQEYISAGQLVQLEVQLPGGSSRPADILVAGSGDATPVAVDVSVVHPLHLSALSAEDTPGSLATARETEKVAASKVACDLAGWRFAAVCAETSGAWGPGAVKVIRALARKQSMRSGRPVGEAAGALWRRLGTAVAKGTAQMLLRSFPVAFNCAQGS